MIRRIRRCLSIRARRSPLPGPARGSNATPEWRTDRCSKSRGPVTIHVSQAIQHGFHICTGLELAPLDGLAQSAVQISVVDLPGPEEEIEIVLRRARRFGTITQGRTRRWLEVQERRVRPDRKSTRLNSSHAN